MIKNVGTNSFKKVDFDKTLTIYEKMRFYLLMEKGNCYSTKIKVQQLH